MICSRDCQPSKALLEIACNINLSILQRGMMILQYQALDKDRLLARLRET